jgi:chemotaxis protein methyltransferase CheR
MTPIAVAAPLRAAYMQLLEHQFGLRISTHQAALFDEVLARVLATSPYTDPADLYAALAAGSKPRLLEVLAASMTVGETHFFRVTPQIEALRRLILPDLIARHGADRRIRIWSAGCSTGQEPYTLAMLLCEQLLRPQDWQIELVATDLNRSALDVARRAVYDEWSFRDSPAEFRARYFTPTGNRWQLSDEIRRMVRFAHLNLAEDPLPFVSEGERIDLIVCRNVTIYFGKQATQRLYDRLALAMELAGWLVLGPSDPMPAPRSGLEMLAFFDALLWRRKEVAPITGPPAPPPPAPKSKRPIARTRRIAPRTPRSTNTRPHVAPPENASMDPQVHLQMGMLRLGEGAPAAALESLRRASFLDDTSALVQFNLGSAYRQMGDPARSHAAFSRARRLLAGIADDEPLSGGDGGLATGELRQAVELQLADLEATMP